MALVKLGGLAQDVRGSLNGSTFSRNRGGAYVRTKVSPVNPLTPVQTQQRAIFSVVTKGWQGLTATEQAAWIGWALYNTVTNVFGDAIKLSGIAAYTKINGTLGTFGLPYLTSPPPPPGTPGPLATSVTGVASTNTITVTWASALAGGEMYQVWTTAGKSAGAQIQNSDFRLAANITGIAAAATTAVIPSTRNDKLVFNVGQNVAALIVRLDENGVIMDSTRFNFVGA